MVVIGLAGLWPEVALSPSQRVRHVDYLGAEGGRSTMFDLKLQQERNLVPKLFNGEDKRRGGAVEETQNTRKDPVGTASVQPQL